METRYREDIINYDKTLTVIFRDFVKYSSEFKEALDIIEKNSKGKIWLIGSFLYRNIINKIRKRKLKSLEEIDIDFLVRERSEEEIYIPEGWELRMTSYGNPYFLKREDNIKVDLNYLFNMHSILTRDIEPTIESFLTGTPLTVQSIVYDCDKKKVGGEIGINSIKKRIVKINHLPEAGFEAQNKGISLVELIRQKAEELRFKYILP